MINERITPNHSLTHKEAEVELGKSDVVICKNCLKRRVCYKWVEGECLECIRNWEFGCDNEGF